MPKQSKPYSQLKKGPLKRGIVAQAKRDLDTLGRGDGPSLVADLLNSKWGKPIVAVNIFKNINKVYIINKEIY